MDLKNMFKPASIAIVGASNDSSKIGGRLYNNLIRHGYEGLIYPINSKYPEIQGLKCYSSLCDINKAVDIALVAIPANGVSSVLEDCGRSGVQNAIVFSSGFSETGENGKLREAELRKISKKYEIAICGPNCVGIINSQDKIAMSFSQFLNAPTLIPGSIAFISQSGALGGSLLNRSQDMKIGFSYFASVGNEAVLELSDFIEYLIHDEKTKVIAALIEGIKDTRKFLRVCELALKNRKPIVVMKVGKTEEGGKAASSHTGAMTGSDEVYEAIFRQKGVVRVEDLDDLHLTAATLLKSKLPKGNRVGILTSTGGGGVILTDKLIESGMIVPDPSAETMLELGEVIPSFTSVKNPFDLTAQLINDPLLFRKAIDIFARDEKFDAIIVATSMVAGELSEKRASFIIEAERLLRKPMLTWWAAGSLSYPGIKMLESSQVPFFTSAGQCVNALKALVEYSDFVKMDKKDSAVKISASLEKKEQVRRLLEGPERVLTEDQGKEILRSYGIPITSERVGEDYQEVKEIARDIGYPVALKVISPEIMHKTESGGLKLNIKDEKELNLAYDEILSKVRKHSPDAEIRGILVQEMVNPGQEVIVGLIQDAQFGPMVMFGLGGIFVEVLRDFSLRLAPLEEKDAWKMIRETKGYGILKGVRGGERSDVEAIVKVLMGVSSLALDHGDFISEIDINPLVVYPEGKGVKVVDCLFVKKPENK